MQGHFKIRLHENVGDMYHGRRLKSVNKLSDLFSFLLISARLLIYYTLVLVLLLLYFWSTLIVHENLDKGYFGKIIPWTFSLHFTSSLNMDIFLQPFSSGDWKFTLLLLLLFLTKIHVKTKKTYKMVEDNCKPRDGK